MTLGTARLDLRKERLNRGKGIRELAREIGVPEQTIRRAERGEGAPSPANAFKIASFYGYQVTDVWPLEPASGEAA